MTATMLTTSTQGLHQHHGQHQKQGQPIDENAASPALRGEQNNGSSLGRSISPDRQPEETTPLLEDDGADGRIDSLSRELMAQLDCAACLEGDKHHVRQRRQQQQQDQEEEEEEDIEDMEEGQEKKGEEGTTAATNMFPRATPSLQAVMMMMHGPFAEAFEGAMALSKRMENSTKEVFENARTVALQNQAAVEGEWTKVASALQHSNITLTADKARIAECNSNLEAKQIVLEKKIQALETTAAAEKAERDRVASEAKEPWEASPPGRTSTSKIFDNSRTATQPVPPSSNVLASACCTAVPIPVATTTTTEATTTKTADAATAMRTTSAVTTADPTISASSAVAAPPSIGDFPGVTAQKGQAEPTTTTMPSSSPCASSVRASVADMAEPLPLAATTTTTTTTPALATVTAAAPTSSPAPAATTAPAPTPPLVPAATIAAAPTPPLLPAATTTATTTAAPTPSPSPATTTAAAPTPHRARDATTTAAPAPVATSAAASAAFNANPKCTSLNGKENETPQHGRGGKASAGKTGGRPRWVGDGVGSAAVSPPGVSSAKGRTSTQNFSPGGRAPLGTVSINTTPRSVLADRPRRRKAVACFGTPTLKLIAGIPWIGLLDGFGGGGGGGGGGVSRASVTRPKDAGVVSNQGEGAKESRRASFTRETVSSMAAARPTAIMATERAVSVKRSSTRSQLADIEKTDGMARRLRSSGPTKQAALAVIAEGQRSKMLTGAEVASRTRQAPTTRGGGKVVRKQWV